MAKSGRERSLAHYHRNKAEINRKKQARETNDPGFRKRSAANCRKSRYGITEEQYQEMLIAQGRKCAICETGFEPGVKVCVDHCHDTKEVRGLLCDSCNVGLGRFRDDAALLARAVEYLATRCNATLTTKS